MPWEKAIMDNPTLADLIYKRVSKNIVNIRREKNITQSSLASLLNISQPLLSSYETGKRKPNLETIEYIGNKLGVSLYKLMFEELGEAGESASILPFSSSPSDQINKCSTHNYYCYYIKEQSDGEKKVKANIHSFTARIGVPQGTHRAKAEVVFPKTIYQGTLEMDESYAHLNCCDKKRDFFLLLTFYYYRGSSNPYYQGGLGLLQRTDYNNIPVAQYCIISPGEIKNLNESMKSEMQSLLKTTENTGKISTWRFSSNGILRLTKTHDSQVLDWLRSKNLTRK